MTGRVACGKLIHDARLKFKNYLLSLKSNGDMLYELEMSQHRNKEGFYDPKYKNYNAKRMVEDDRFIPKYGSVWYKSRWGTDTWSKTSPTPKKDEPYWHTTHSIQKSNDWIFEHLDHMKQRVGDVITQDEFEKANEKCLAHVTAY